MDILWQALTNHRKPLMNTNTIGTLMDTAHNLPTDEFVLGKSRTIPESKKRKNGLGSRNGIWSQGI